MKIVTQILAVNKGKDQDATIVLGCSLTALQQVETFVDKEVRIKFWLDGTDEDKDSMLGQVVSTVGSSSSFKFKIKCPGTENIKTSQLSTLCGKEIDMNIDIDN